MKLRFEDDLRIEPSMLSLSRLNFRRDLHISGKIPIVKNTENPQKFSTQNKRDIGVFMPIPSELNVEWQKMQRL